MKRYKCPLSLKVVGLPFLMCQQKVNGKAITANMMQEASNAYCPHQSYCSCSDGNENTAEAKQCYENQALKKG